MFTFAACVALMALAGTDRASRSRARIYCRRRHLDGMVDVRERHEHSPDSCASRPDFNFAGSNTTIYCKHHAADGMVDVSRKGCSHRSCMKWPEWGVVTGGVPTTCPRYKAHLVGGLYISVTERYKVVSCEMPSRWAGARAYSRATHYRR